jgi:hypothetical protein
MRTSWPNESLLHELSRRNPVADHSLAGSELTPQATALLSRVIASEPGVSVTSAGDGGHSSSDGVVMKPRNAAHGRRPRLVAIGLTASLLVVALVFVSVAPPGRTVNAGAAILSRTAMIADEQAQSPPLAPGQFLYIKKFELTDFALAVGGSGIGTIGSHDPYLVLQPLVTQTWLAADGSGRSVQTGLPGPPRFLNPKDRAKWVAAGSPEFGAMLDGPGDSLSVAPRATMSALPTRPSVLGPLLASGKVDPLTGGLLPKNALFASPKSLGPEIQTIASLLGQPYASPALRSALYRVASRLPGVHLLGNVTDGIGRRGTAVEYTWRGWRSVLIFDPATSALLEQKLVEVTPDAGHEAISAVAALSIYEASGVVDSTTATPKQSSGR